MGRTRRKQAQFAPRPNAALAERLSALEALVQQQQAVGAADDSAWRQYVSARGSQICDKSGRVYFPQTWHRQLAGYALAYMHNGKLYLGGSYMGQPEQGFSRAFGVWQAIRHSICVSDIWLGMQRTMKATLEARLKAARAAMATENTAKIIGKDLESEIRKRQDTIAAAAKAYNGFRWTDLPDAKDHRALNAICSQISCEQARGIAFDVLQRVLLDSRLVTRTPKPTQQETSSSQRISFEGQRPTARTTAQGTGEAETPSSAQQAAGSSQTSAETAKQTGGPQQIDAEISTGGSEAAKPAADKVDSVEERTTEETT